MDNPQLIPTVTDFKCLLSGFHPSQYENVQWLASGSFGIVNKYKKREEEAEPLSEMPQFVARKKIHIIHPIKDTIESKILETLYHENVLKIFYWQTVKDSDYIEHLILFTELCDQNLEQFMKEKESFNLFDIKILGRQLIQGLNYLHKSLLIHRDIKPKNILVNKSGGHILDVVLKLCDFGLARFMPHSASSCDTQELTAVGTRIYTSPEVFQASMVEEKASSRHPYSSDMFSLGVVIFELITRKKPFKLEHLCQESLHSESIVREKIWYPNVTEALVLMLDWDPEKRPNAERINEYFRYDIEDLDFSCMTSDLITLKFLLTSQVDVTQVSWTGRTPLFTASLVGHVGVVKLLLEYKADVKQATTHEGNSPLCVASQNGYFEVVKLLLENDADVNQTRSSDGATPLLMASRNGHVEIAEILLKYLADANQATTPAPTTLWKIQGVEALIKSLPFGWALKITPEGRVFYSNHMDKTTSWNHPVTGEPTPLLAPTVDEEKLPSGWEKRKNLDGRTFYIDHEKRETQWENPVTGEVTLHSTTPLCVASSNGHIEVVKLLLNNKADANKARSDGISPLQCASGEGYLVVVQLLLENKADVNKARSDGTSPLYGASYNGHLDVVQLLLENKADVNKARSDGKSPLYGASEKGHLDVVQLLLENKANVNLADTNTGFTPLCVASQEGHVEVVKLLLKNKTNVNQATTDCDTSLYVASENGHAEVVRVLLENMADVNKAKTSNGATSLFIASEKGHLEVVKLLLEADAKQTNTKNGLTPLDVAIDKNNFEVVRLLLEARGREDVDGIVVSPASPSSSPDVSRSTQTGARRYEVEIKVKV